MALFSDPDNSANNNRSLRGGGKASGGSNAANSTTVLLDGLAMGAIFGYFTTLKFPGNQVGGVFLVVKKRGCGWTRPDISYMYVLVCLGFDVPHTHSRFPHPPPRKDLTNNQTINNRRWKFWWTRAPPTSSSPPRSASPATRCVLGGNYLC